MKHRIKQIRKVLELSQTEFGRRLGKTLRMVQYYEAGERNIDDGVLFQLGKEFNVNSDWMKTGSGEMFEETDGSISADSSHNYTSHEETIIEYYNDLSEADKKEVFLYLQKAAETKRIKQNFSDKVKKEQTG